MAEARDKAKAWLDEQECRRMAEIEEQILQAKPIELYDPWPEYPDEEREDAVVIALCALCILGVGITWWVVS